MKNKSLAKNTVIYTIRTLCSLVFPIITFPYISRVLGVNGVGVYNFSVSFVSYFSLLASLGISTYAIREGAKLRDRKEEFQKFAEEIFSFNIVSTVCSGFLLGICLELWDKLAIYKSIIIILSVSVYLTTLGTEWILTIYEEFVFVAIRSIVFQLISIGLMFVMVRSAEDVLNYALISVIASAGSNLLNWVYVRHYFKYRITLNINLSQHCKPILVLFASTIASQIYINSDSVMLGIIKNDYEVGIYSSASKLYNIVRTALTAVITVMLPRLSFLSSNKKVEEYKNLLRKSMLLLMLVVIPASVGLVILSGDIIRVFCGNEYISSKLPLIILSIALIFSVLGSFIANSVLVVNAKERVILKATTVGAIVNVLTNIIMIAEYGALGAAITTLVSEIIVFLIQLRYAFRDLSFSKDEMIEIGKIIISTFIMTVGGMFAGTFFEATLKRLVVMLVVSILSYFLSLVAIRQKIFCEYLILILQKRII